MTSSSPGAVLVRLALTLGQPHGNIFATAHKENWQLALAPDLNSPSYTRSMSWAWVSSRLACGREPL